MNISFAVVEADASVKGFFLESLRLTLEARLEVDPLVEGVVVSCAV